MATIRLNKNIDIKEFIIKEEAEGMIIEGYASTYGNVDSHNDVIEKGAFSNLDTKKVKLLLQHNLLDVIGVIKEFKDDAVGLWIKAKISETTKGKDTYALIKDGAIDSFSVGMTISSSGYEYRGKTRHLKAVKLQEISLVTMPANENALIYSVKGLSPMNKRDIEEGLRMIGLSQKEALILISKGYSALEEHRDCVMKQDNRDGLSTEIKSLLNEYLLNLTNGKKNGK